MFGYDHTMLFRAGNSRTRAFLTDLRTPAGERRYGGGPTTEAGTVAETGQLRKLGSCGNRTAQEAKAAPETRGTNDRGQR